MIKELKNFKEAWKQLQTAWTEDKNADLTQNYPFEEDFGDLRIDVSKWVETNIGLIEKKESRITIRLIMRDNSTAEYSVAKGYGSKYIKNAMDMSVVENRKPNRFVIGGIILNK